ncbi:unnamed protein product, partial [Prorocentrum cordatum]
EINKRKRDFAPAAKQAAKQAFAAAAEQLKARQQERELMERRASKVYDGEQAAPPGADAAAGSPTAGELSAEETEEKRELAEAAE